MPRDALEAETLALAQKIAANDPFALKLAKASINEMLDAQGQRQSFEGADKNDMLTIPHRRDLGTFGTDVTAKGAKERIKKLNGSG